MSKSEEKELEFSKEDYFFLAKIYSKCESYEEMTACIKNIIAVSPLFNTDLRNYFSLAFKNYLSEKRQRLKVISGLLKKQIKNLKDSSQEDTKVSLLKELKKSLEKEIFQINLEVQGIIDEYLLPNNKKKDDVVFYNKMKADYYRYMKEMEIEIEIEGEKNENFEAKAEEYYKKAVSLASSLPPISFVRLNTILNYAIFLGESKGEKDKAIELAKNAIEEIANRKEDLENEENKESIVVLQLIQENLLLWTGGKMEFDDEEAANNEVNFEGDDGNEMDFES